MKNALPVFVIILGLAALYPLQRWMDQGRPREPVGEEFLYFSSGETVKKMSLGMEGLVADIYWIRTVQYFGRKVLDSGLPLAAGRTKEIRMDLLAPLLKIIVTLDPQHTRAYRFGAMFLPERDLPAAIELLEYGVRNNPDDWRLYQDLGYINWQANNYTEAGKWYELGGHKEGAPWWMRDLAGFMKIKGESREAARAIYSSYLSSDDPNIYSQAVSRLKQLQSLDEMDAINALLASYKAQTGSCPATLRPFAAKLRAMGLTLNGELVPVDPDGFAYVLDAGGCKVNLSIDSTVPR
jgi:tetratricopeptide (TPR) repeat protein